MTYEELITLDTTALIDEIKSTKTDRKESANIEYYGGKHPITTDVDRQDKTIDLFEKDTNGDFVKENGQKKKSGTKTITRARIVLEYPEQIVNTKTAFIVGNGIELTNQSEDLADQFALFKEQFFSKLKMDNIMREAVGIAAVETHCALIFFYKNGETEQGLKVNILSYSKGDTIYPYFDSDGDMIAFMREFKQKKVVDGAIVEVEEVQIYMQGKVIIQSGTDPIEEITNPYEKIQIVYIDQKTPEFEKAKGLVSNQEYSISQLYEVNRRVGNPAVVMQGDIVDAGDPTPDVKVFKSKPVQTAVDSPPIFGTVTLLEAQTAPDSIKLQHEIVDKNIERASWIDLSKLREIVTGGAMSGYAMEIALTDAFAKRAVQIGIYNDAVIRCISIIKTMLAAAGGEFSKMEELKVSNRFKSLLPDDILLQTEVLSSAVHGGVTSEDNAVRLSSLNANPEKIIEEKNTVPAGVAK